MSIEMTRNVSGLRAKVRYKPSGSDIPDDHTLIHSSSSRRFAENAIHAAYINPIPGPNSSPNLAL